MEDLARPERSVNTDPGTRRFEHPLQLNDVTYRVVHCGRLHMRPEVYHEIEHSLSKCRLVKYPKKWPFWCCNCGLPFETAPFFLVTEILPDGTVCLNVLRWFCALGCYWKYLNVHDQPTVSPRYRAAFAHYAYVYLKYPRERPFPIAPDNYCRAEYGGPMTRAEFRERIAYGEVVPSSHTVVSHRSGPFALGINMEAPRSVTAFETFSPDYTHHPASLNDFVVRATGEDDVGERQLPVGRLYGRARFQAHMGAQFQEYAGDGRASTLVDGGRVPSVPSSSEEGTKPSAFPPPDQQQTAEHTKEGEEFPDNETVDLDVDDEDDSSVAGGAAETEARPDGAASLTVLHEEGKADEGGPHPHDGTKGASGLRALQETFEQVAHGAEEATHHHRADVAVRKDDDDSDADADERYAAVQQRLFGMEEQRTHSRRAKEGGEVALAFPEVDDALSGEDDDDEEEDEDALALARPEDTASPARPRVSLETNAVGNESDGPCDDEEEDDEEEDDDDDDEEEEDDRAPSGVGDGNAPLRAATTRAPGGRLRQILSRRKRS